MKTILVTGSTDGIGKQTAFELVKLGYNVILHGREKSRCEKTANEISALNNVEKPKWFVADFSSLAQVRDLAELIIKEYGRIDVLINNAGIYSKQKTLTIDGFESTFAVNHLAPFLLTNLLLQNISDRIVNVSSMAHAWAKMDFDNLNAEKYYDAGYAYGLSKLCNVLFTNKLARIINGKPTVNSLHPGVISTKLLHAGWGVGGASLESGAETSVFLATSKSVENVSGRYFADMEERKSSEISRDEKVQDKLWEISIKFVQAFMN